MKKLIATCLTFCLLSTFAYAQTGSKSSKSKSYHSGSYKGGAGSSHKGGSYKNSGTNNHYKKRK